MRLFIAEKPELARAICAGLGGSFTKKDGYFVKGKDAVTYCFGHMLSLVDPEDVDAKYKTWSMDALPLPMMLPPRYKVGAKDKIKQVNVIHKLLKDATTIVNAGDPDDEGQYLIDELLRYFADAVQGKEVLRLLINDNNVKVVQKSLANMRPNADFVHLGYQAEARSLADQAFGYNLTRAYTLSQDNPSGNVVSVGRVQTPILGLVVRRDREHKGHKHTYYQQIRGTFWADDVRFVAKYQPKDTDPTDDKNRLIDASFAQKIAEECKGKPVVIHITTTQKTQPPPLPYNLLKLQQDCARLFGIKPDACLAITQTLRETHQAITYNRSDCQYLSNEQHGDAKEVMDAISSFEDLGDACLGANVSQKSRAFDSQKVTAHHAIIPTATSANLLGDHARVYGLIARAYLAQFYPDYTYDETTLVLDCVGHTFTAKSRVTLTLGWRALYQDEDKDDVQRLDLRNLDKAGTCLECISKQEATKPPALYSMTKLLGDLTQVAKYVKDPHLGKILKAKDKDKSGEQGGIGTPATRASIIATLFERGFLQEEGKSIKSTQAGQALYDALDDLIKYPDMTAIWHEALKDIKTADDVSAFIEQMHASTILPIVERRKRLMPEEKRVPCPKCGRDMRRFKSKFGKGMYWFCTGYKDTQDPCNHKMDDKDGTPVMRPVAQVSGFECKTCGRPLIHRQGTYKTGVKKGESYSFFGCSDFPRCKQSYPEVNGAPKYD